MNFYNCKWFKPTLIQKELDDEEQQNEYEPPEEAEFPMRRYNKKTGEYEEVIVHVRDRLVHYKEYIQHPPETRGEFNPDGEYTIIKEPVVINHVSTQEQNKVEEKPEEQMDEEEDNIEVKEPELDKRSELYSILNGLTDEKVPKKYRKQNEYVIESIVTNDPEYDQFTMTMKEAHAMFVFRNGAILHVQYSKYNSDVWMIDSEGKRHDILTEHDPELVYPYYTYTAQLQRTYVDDKGETRTRTLLYPVELTDEKIVRGYNKEEGRGIDHFFQGNLETMQIVDLYPNRPDWRTKPDIKAREMKVHYNVETSAKYLKIEGNIADIYAKRNVYYGTSLIHGIWFSLYLKGFKRRMNVELNMNDLLPNGVVKDTIQNIQIKQVIFEYK